MDGFSEIIRVIEATAKGSKTIEEISITTEMTISEVFEIFKAVFRYSIDAIWGIELIDENGSPIYDLGEFKGFKEKIIVKATKKNLNYYDLYDLNDLNSHERWVLYDLIKECKSTFIKTESELILNSYEREFEDKYKLISDNRIIKQRLNVFNFDEKIAFELYDSIKTSLYINITLSNGTKLNHIAPVKISYNEDLKKWYLVYDKKKNIEHVKLESITDVEVLDEFCVNNISLKYYWGNGNAPIVVKIRVYDENKAKELAIRFLSRKNIKSMRNEEDYFEMEVMVADTNLFVRWARSMAPYLVILEPEILRNRMKDEIKEWLKNIV